MDLLSISRVIWKHKLLVIPVALVTLAAASYLLAFSKPLYQMTNDYVIAPPPSAPSATQIAENPGLAKINPNNVYARFYDQSIIADALVSRMSGQFAQDMLVKEGADPRNTVAITSVNGSTEPGVQVTATGSTAAEALTTSRLVGAALTHNLYTLQSAQQTNPYYMFTALQVATSGAPKVKVSSTLRSVLAVLGVGVLLLFLAVSLGDAIDKRRAERRSSAKHAVNDGSPSAWAPDSAPMWQPPTTGENPPNPIRGVPNYANGHTPYVVEAPGE